MPAQVAWRIERRSVVFVVAKGDRQTPRAGVAQMFRQEHYV